MNDSYIGLFRIIEEWAVKTPLKEAALIEGRRITYGELKVQAEKLACCLYNAGVRRGDRVGILFPNSIIWYICFWGIIRLGAVAVPFGPQIGLYEMRELFERTGIRVCFTCPVFRGRNHLRLIREHMRSFYDLKLVVVDGELEEEGRSLLSLDSFYREYGTPEHAYHAALRPEDPLMLVCTSGTTGKPKIILVEHEGFLRSTGDMASYLGFAENTTMLLGMPLYHQGGFGMGMQSLIKGGKVIYQEQFTPGDFLRLIGEEKATVLQLSATLAKILISDPGFNTYDLSSLNMAYFAGEALPDGLAEFFYIRQGMEVVNVLGSSEATSMLVWDSRRDRGFPVNDFRELPFTRVLVLDDQGRSCPPGGDSGLIHIYTDAVLREYFRNPRESAERIRLIEGKRWFNTGDLGMRLAEGRVRFSGRRKRIIKRGANLIYPEEVESCLLSHPHIVAVAVVGEEHEVYGEKTVAYIQFREGSAENRGSLLKFCKGKLSAYKIPDSFIITEEIPKEIGKIQYKVFRDRRSHLD